MLPFKPNFIEFYHIVMRVQLCDERKDADWSVLVLVY